MEPPPQDPLTEEALRWAVVLADREATDDERRAFAAWLANGPAHEAAWERARHVWSRAALLEPVVRAGHGGRRGTAAVLPFAGTRTGPAAPAGLSRRRWLGTAAAGLGALAIGGTLARSGLFADERTGVGERRNLALADGSTVELGSASALSLAFTDERRALTLHQGEAFFTVAPDPSRPFVVAAANGRSEALGTAFNVKRLPDAVVVSVTEHAVAVAADGAGTVRVAAGRQVRYGPDGLESVAPADLAAVQAWRRDRLVFYDAPLGDVIADLERYRHGRIVVTDTRIAALPVTAVIDTRQTDAALRTIADTLPVRVRRVTDLLVLLSPRDDGPAG